MSSLILSTEGRIFRIVRLREGLTLVGRSPQSHLVLDSPTASKFHAVFHVRASSVSIRDLQSTNGTRVNNEPVSTSQLLHGDRVEIANVEIEFVQKNLYNAEDLPNLPHAVDTPPKPIAETVPGALESGGVARNKVNGRRIGGTAGPSWFGDAVAFSILARGREISAFITADALQSRFSARLMGPDGVTNAIAAYEQHHVAIDVAAFARYMQTEREPVWLSASDF